MRNSLPSNGTESAQKQFDELVDQITRRLQAGESVEVESFVREAPAWEDRLRRMWPGLLALAELGCSNDPDDLSLGSRPPFGEDPIQGSLGDFRLIREIGRGGMGVVYEAEQVSLARRVALKVLPFAGMLDPRQLQRFQNEARAAAGLHHPNIVPVHSVGCDRGVHYYAMQYIEGRTLAEVIAELNHQSDPRANADASPLSQAAGQLISEEPLPGSQHQAEFESTVLFNPNAVPTSPSHPEPAFLQEAVATKPVANNSTESPARSKSNLIRSKDYCRNIAQLGIQIAEALDYAHSLGITHRDIKPSNLLLDGRGTVWVADFGLAQVGTEGNLTVTGEMLGTLRYMSPEQASGQKGLLDQRTDIYSLGITLYELLTLEPAFPGTDRKELLEQVLNREPIPPRRHNPAISRDLETIIGKATSKEATGRYRTAREVAEDLGRFLHHQPIRAKRLGFVELGLKWSRRHIRAVVVAVSMLILLLGTAAGISLVWYEWERSARESSRVLLYLSDMKLVSDAIESRDYVRAAQLLERHIPKEGEKDLRVFEWHYYNKLIHQPEVVALDQGAWVDDVEASPDGLWLATTAASGTVRIYDTKTWTLQQSFPTEADSVHGLAWSPDGQRLAAVCGDGHLHVWELASGLPLLAIQAHAEGANDVVFSPDGKKLYTCGEDFFAKQWDVDTGQEQLAFTGHTGVIYAIAISPDGEQLATASGDATYAIWNTETTELIQHVKPRPPVGRITCVAFSPNGRFVAAASTFGYVYLSDLNSKASVNQPQKLDRVDGVRFLGGGKWLATVDFGGAVHLYEVPSELAPTLPFFSLGWIAHKSPIISLTTIGDGETVITGGRDGMVRVWKPELQATSWHLPIINGRSCLDFEIGPDNRLYCVNEGIEIWDLDERKHLDTFANLPSPWEQIACSRDGQFLAAFQTGKLALYDLATHQSVREWPIEETSKVWELSISDDGRFIACPEGVGGLITVYDRDVPESQRQFPINQCNTFAISHDGRWLAAGHGNEFQMFDLQTEGEPRLFTGHVSTVKNLEFSSDGKRLASVSADRLLKVWDLATGEEQYSHVADIDEVASVTFSGNGNTIGTWANWAGNRRINLWDAATGQTLGTLVCQNTIVGKPRFAPDSLRLITLEAIGGGYTHFIYDAAPPSKGYVRTSLAPTNVVSDPQVSVESDEDLKPDTPPTEPEPKNSEPPAPSDQEPKPESALAIAEKPRSPVVPLTESSLVHATPISGGDYDGDGKTDLAIYTPITRQFRIDYSGNGLGPIFQTDIQYVYGEAGDYPLAGDYDGDGKSDLVVCKNKTRKFYIDYSGDGFNPNGQADVEYVGGAPGDIPLSGDFDGDGKADLAVCKPTTREYHIDFSTNGLASVGQADFVHRFGRPGDIPLAGDYDGDGKLDFIIYRPNVQWFYADTLTTAYQPGGSVDFGYTLGHVGDIPLTGDFDGDGKSDFAVYRPKTHSFYIDISTNGVVQEGQVDLLFAIGDQGDIPLSGDYDGDGKSDLVVYKPPTCTFSIDYSGNGFSFVGQADIQHIYGEVGDTPLAGDYDGDGKSDLVVYKPNHRQFHIDFSSNSLDGQPDIQHVWGEFRDIPLSGDYDGDGKSDLVLYRPKNKGYLVDCSANGFDSNGQPDLFYRFGGAEYIPLAGDYDGDGKADFIAYVPEEQSLFVDYSGNGFRFQGIGKNDLEYGGNNRGEIPLSADYDGDGKADFAFYTRKSRQFTIDTSGNGFTSPVPDLQIQAPLLGVDMKTNQ